MHLVRTSCNFRNSMPCQKGNGSLLRTHIFWQCVYFLQLLYHVKWKDGGAFLPSHIPPLPPNPHPIIPVFFSIQNRLWEHDTLVHVLRYMVLGKMLVSRFTHNVQYTAKVLFNNKQLNAANRSSDKPKCSIFLNTKPYMIFGFIFS